jgi:hypothetical protein
MDPKFVPGISPLARKKKDGHMRYVSGPVGFRFLCAVTVFAVIFSVRPTAGEDLHLLPVAGREEAPQQRVSAQAQAPSPLPADASGPTGCGTWQWANPRPQGNGLYGLTYGANKFVATGEKGTVLTSSNGSEWVVQPATTSRMISSTAWVGTQFMAGVSDEFRSQAP